MDEFDNNAAAKESEVKVQKLFSEPKRVVEKYAVGDGAENGRKHMVAINWVLSDTVLDPETELALGFLDHLMLGTPGSPLRKALMESGLGESIIGGGIEDELRQPQFSIGLKGVAEEDIPKVEELVFSTLKRLAEESFSADAVEASMNTIEFSLRENNTGSFPRGLSLMLRSMVSTFSVTVVTQYFFFEADNGIIVCVNCSYSSLIFKDTGWRLKFMFTS